jgi:alanyl-tRNA synthetase
MQLLQPPKGAFMTLKDYLADSTRTNGEATVLDILRGETIVVRLDRTIFHAQGGGQKADRGRIGNAVVIHVTHNADNVDHHVESVDDLQIGSVVVLEIDKSWRRLNAAYHTAGHLLASVIERSYPGLKAVSGHQWPNEARVEFIGDTPVDQISIDAVNQHLLSDLEADLAVSIQGDPMADRAIKIGAYDAIPCGGTHVATLSEIGSITARTIKSKGGRIRISYEASPSHSR